MKSIIRDGPPPASATAAARRTGQVVEQRRHVVREVGPAGEEPEVGVRPGGLRVVVPVARWTYRRRVLSSSRRTTRQTLQWVLRPTKPEHDVDAGLSSSFAQRMFRSSSSRALSSMTAVTCLPRSAAGRGADDWAVATGPVERLLDGQHPVVVRRRSTKSSRA